jgi:hypothetical protein
MTSEAFRLAAPVALTSLQAEVLYCLLTLLAAKQISSESVGAELGSETATESPNLAELKTWAEVMVRSQPNTYSAAQLSDLQSVTVAEARQFLIESGFSVQAVDQAWQLIQAAGSVPPLT